MRARRAAWGAATWSLAAHLFVFGLAIDRSRGVVERRVGPLARVEFEIRGVPAASAERRDDLPVAPPRPGDPSPTLSGPADAWRDTSSSPWPNADVDTPDKRAAARGGRESGGTPSWTGRNDGDEELHAQSWNDPGAYRLERHRDSDQRLTPESIARLPDPGVDAAHREKERRALAGQPAPAPRPEPGAAEDLDPGIGAPPAGPPEVAAVDSATARSGAVEVGAARPWNPEGDPATEAPRHGPRQDDVDSAQASNETHPVPFELSRPSAGGRGGEGVAGPQRGLGNSASSPRGGRGQGGTPHAVALDANGGLSTHARRQDAYFRKLFRKLVDSLEFPPRLAAALEQGNVVVTFTLREDGTVDNVRLIRGSGFIEFDQAALVAVEKAAPFDRMPAEVSAGRGSVEVTAPIRFKNPLIR